MIQELENDENEMRFIISSIFKLRYLIIVLAAAFIAYGLGQLKSIPLDVYPEFNPPLVEVQTEALGLSAAEMEAMITLPLEADLLNGVAWLDQIYSESVTGLSSILLVFEPGTDPIRARQMVQERLIESFALPNVSKPPTMLQPLSSTNRVMMVGLSSDEISLIELGVLARWNIKPRLMGVPGVANVAIWGQRERQLQVQVDPKRLHANGVTLSQVIETTGEALWVSPLSFLQASTPGTSGWIDTANQRLSVRHILPISTPSDLAKVSLIGRQGLLLGDVAEVVEDHQPLIGDAQLTDGRGVILVVEKFPGASTLDVTRGVEEALETMRPGLSGIKIDSSVFRPANYIETAIANLSNFLIIASLLVVLVLWTFLRNVRYVLIGITSIILSLITSAFILNFSGATFNMMVFLGLAAGIGVIVDDAVIDTQSLASSLTKRGKIVGSIKNIVLESIKRTRGLITSSYLIILLTVLPVLFIKGLSGVFFKPLAVSYIASIISSALIATIITPALSLIFLTKATFTYSKASFVVKLEGSYKRLLAAIFKRPRPLIFAYFLITLAGISVLPFLGNSLLPSFRQTDLLIEWEAVPGTSGSEMNRVMGNVSDELRAIPGVKGAHAQVGRAITGDLVVGINSAELWINIDPKADYDLTLASIKEVIADYPGFFREVTTYQPERTGEALAQSDQDIVVRIYGHEFEELKKLALEVGQILSGTEGIIETQMDIPAMEPQVEIEVDLAAAERNQIVPGDVRRQSATLLSGLQVGNLYEEQKVFDVIVWGIPEIRNSLTDIENLLIDTPGGQVRLGDLADVRIVPSPIIIKRDAVSRFIDVEANVNGRNLDAVSDEVEAKLKNVNFPLEYSARVLGKNTDWEESEDRIIVIGILVSIGIFLLLHAKFESLRLASIIAIALPLALAGGFLGVFAAGGFSLGSLVGLFIIFAISIRGSILLLNHFQDFEKKGAAINQKLVLESAKDRLVPTLLTSSSLGLVFLSLVFFGNRAGFEILRPMAAVVLGGLTTSSLVNLFVLPTFYLRAKSR